MKNVQIEVTEDNRLIIQIDLLKEFGESGSGKSFIIASSEGNTKVKDDIFMGLNVFRKKPK